MPCVRDNGGACVGNDGSLPLFINKTDENDVELIDEAHATVSMVPHRPNRTTQDTYVGTDSELCDALAGTHASIDWSGYVTFNVTSCATVPFSEGGHGLPSENNCKVKIVRVVRTNRGSGSGTGSAGPGETSSYELPPASVEMWGTQWWA